MYKYNKANLGHQRYCLQKMFYRVALIIQWNQVNNIICCDNLLALCLWADMVVQALLPRIKTFNFSWLDIWRDGKKTLLCNQWSGTEWSLKYSIDCKVVSISDVNFEHSKCCDVMCTFFLLFSLTIIKITIS